jgi:putative nucleotidyltransferase with HDIG domain
MARNVILVVDDDASSRETLGDILELEGYAVLAAPTGEAAEAIIRSRPVDAAFLDLRLPDRSGVEVLRVIREISPETEVLMVSGNASLASAIEAMRCGAFGYILKPVNVDEVLACIRRALERQRMARDLRRAEAENRERIQLLLEAAQVVSSSLDLPEVLHTLADQMVRRLQVTLCRILVLDQDRTHLTVRAAFPVREVPWDLGLGRRIGLDLLPRYRRVVEQQEVVLLRRDDPHGPLSETETALVLAKEASSALLVPMVTRGQIRGMVTLVEARAWERSPITDGKVALCQAMASVAAIAIENALLLGEREKAHLATLAALVSALDARERETQAHSLRVQEYTLRLAQEMGIAEADLTAIAAGALLHDIGKIGIPDAILLKPGALTDEEWREMRRHPQIGSEILRGLTHLEAAGAIVLAHQERWDGSGYPRGLAGPAIPLEARMFAVVDALDAMTSDRPYRERTTIALAREEIARGAGTQFDPEVVAAFLRVPLEEWEGIRRRPPRGCEAGVARLARVTVSGAFPIPGCPGRDHV